MKKYLRIAILTAAMVCMCVIFASAATTSSANIKANYNAPANLHQTYDSTTSVKVEWNAIPGCKYAIQVIDEYGRFDDYGSADITSSPNYYIHGLSQGATYYVRVAACDTYYENGSSTYDPGAWSEPIDVVTEPDGVGYTMKYINATTSSVTVKWDPAAGATGYIAEVKPTDQSGASYSVAGYVGNPSITIKKLDSDSVYTVKVTSVRESYGGYQALSNSYMTLSNCPTVSTKVTGFKADTGLVSTKKLDFKWNKKNNADGYQIEMYNYKTKKTVKKLVKSNRDWSDYYDVIPTAFYKVRIRSYVVTDDNVKKYSAWSAYNYVNLQQEITGEQVGRKAKVKMKWKKVYGADKYKIYVATSYNGTYKLSGTTKNTYYTLTKYGKNSLKTGKTYYLRLEAVKTVGGKTYKSTKDAYQSIYLAKPY